MGKTINTLKQQSFIPISLSHLKSFVISREDLLRELYDVKEAKSIARSNFEATLAPCDYLPRLDTNTIKRIRVPSIRVVCLPYFGIAECYGSADYGYLARRIGERTLDENLHTLNLRYALCHA